MNSLLQGMVKFIFCPAWGITKILFSWNLEGEFGRQYELQENILAINYVISKRVK